MNHNNNANFEGQAGDVHYETGHIRIHYRCAWFSSAARGCMDILENYAYFWPLTQVDVRLLPVWCRVASFDYNPSFCNLLREKIGSAPMMLFRFFFLSFFLRHLHRNGQKLACHTYLNGVNFCFTKIIQGTYLSPLQWETLGSDLVAGQCMWHLLAGLGVTGLLGVLRFRSFPIVQNHLNVTKQSRLIFKLIICIAHEWWLSEEKKVPNSPSQKNLTDLF